MMRNEKSIIQKVHYAINVIALIVFMAIVILFVAQMLYHDMEKDKAIIDCMRKHTGEIYNRKSFDFFFSMCKQEVEQK